MNTVSVKDAAAELGRTVAWVRYYMDLGQLPIGRVVCKPCGKKKTYLIYRDKLDQELGRNNSH